MYGYEYGYHAGHAFFWQPLIVLFWIIVAAVIIYAVMRYQRLRHHECHHGALHVLRERYAKGEISTAEFEERKKALLAE